MTRLHRCHIAASSQTHKGQDVHAYYAAHDQCGSLRRHSGKVAADEAAPSILTNRLIYGMSNRRR